MAARLGVFVGALAEESLDGDVPMGDVHGAVRSLLAAMQCTVVLHNNIVVALILSAFGSLYGLAQASCSRMQPLTLNWLKQPKSFRRLMQQVGSITLRYSLWN